MRTGHSLREDWRWHVNVSVRYPHRGAARGWDAPRNAQARFRQPVFTAVCASEEHTGHGEHRRTYDPSPLAI